MLQLLHARVALVVLLRISVLLGLAIKWKVNLASVAPRLETTVTIMRGRVVVGMLPPVTVSTGNPATVCVSSPAPR